MRGDEWFRTNIEELVELVEKTLPHLRSWDAPQFPAW